MWQPCFGKSNIMHKYVGVYILVLMYNSSSMCYVGNIVRISNIYKFKIYIPSNFLYFLQWNGSKFSTHVLI